MSKASHVMGKEEGGKEWREIKMVKKYVHVSLFVNLRFTFHRSIPTVCG